MAATANSDRVPTDLEGLPFKKDNSPSTSATCGAKIVSPTPTPAPHDEVVHPHAAAAPASRAGEAAQAGRGDEAPGGDQSRRAAHQ